MDKTKLGLRLWGVPSQDVPPIMYIRITAHAVGVGGVCVLYFVLSSS